MRKLIPICVVLAIISFCTINTNEKEEMPSLRLIVPVVIGLALFAAAMYIDLNYPKIKSKTK